MFTSHYVYTPAVELVYRSGHRSIEGPGLAAVCDGQAHTYSVQPATQILEMGHVLQWRVAADDHIIEGCLCCASLARLDGFVGQGAY